MGMDAPAPTVKGVKKTSKIRLQAADPKVHAAIINIVQIVIFWLLATKYTSQRRPITMVDQIQLSKGCNSGRCINTATHRAQDKSDQFHTSSVKKIGRAHV